MAHVQVGIQVRPLGQHDFQKQHGQLEKNDTLGDFHEVQPISHEHWAHRYRQSCKRKHCSQQLSCLLHRTLKAVICKPSH